MRALRYDGPWTMTLTDLPAPAPAPGEVLLKPLAIGICGSDVHGFTGESGRRKPGMVMGHEVVGEVVALGPGVTTLAPGDHVAVFNILGCGVCRFCKAGQQQLCPTKKVLGVNAGTWGAMADLFTAPADILFKVPATLDPALAILPEPIAVGLHAIRKMNPTPDDVVAIVGSGTIGIGLAIGLQTVGVKRFFALDKIPAKLDLIRSFGAETINVDQQDPVQTLKDATGGLGANGSFEAVGAAATVRLAYDLCANGATVVLVGNLAKEFTLPLQGVTTNETTLRGSYGFTKQDFADAVQIVASGRFPLEKLISGTCTLEQTPEVMTRMAKGELQPIKIVIRP